MTQEPLSSKLPGIFEIDETYVGGRLRKSRTVEGKKAYPYCNVAARFNLVMQSGSMLRTWGR